MKEQLLKLKEAALEEIKAVSAIDELDSIKVKYSGKKGELTKLLKGMGKLSAEERPVMGKVANEVRELIETKINEKRRFFFKQRKKFIWEGHFFRFVLVKQQNL